MSTEMWAIGILRKYKLTVDFYLDYVEDADYSRVYWGESSESKTFEQALEHIVKAQGGN